MNMETKYSLYETRPDIDYDKDIIECLTVNRQTYGSQYCMYCQASFPYLNICLMLLQRKQGLIATPLSVLEALVFKVDENNHPWTST